MNDSFGKISSPVPPQSKGGTSRGAQIVQIIKLPDALKTNTQALRIEGQITQTKADGTARILTPEGEVEVKVHGNRQPQVGQKVELEIPAGRPPRQASIRNAPQQNSNPQGGNVQNTPSRYGPEGSATPRPVTTQGPQSGQPSQTQQPSTQPPRSNNVQNVRTNAPLPLPQGANTTPPTPAQPLTPDSAVRLLSVPPAQAQQIATTFTQTLPSPITNILARAESALNITIQNAQSQQTQSLLQIAQPKLQPQTPLLQNFVTTPVQQIQQVPQVTPINLINNLQITAQPVQTTINLLPQILNAVTTPTSQTTIIPTAVQNLTPSISTALTSPPNIAQTIFQTPQVSTTPQATQPITPQTATLIPQQLNFNPAEINQATRPILPQIDVQIIRITPPAVQLSAPALTTPIPAAADTIGLNTQNPILPAATKFTPPLLSVNNATSVTAQVTGFTPQNLPLVTVQWPGSPLPQSFVLQHASNNLQLGTQLQIIPKAIPQTAQGVQALPITMQPNPLLQGFQWPAIDDLYNSLLQISPQAAASLGRSLPTPANTVQIGPAAMMFIAAVRSGDIGGWLGERKIDMLQRIGKSDVLNRLTQSGNVGARAPAPEAATSSDWRAVPLPMFWEGEIHKITLYTRQENQSDQQNQKEGGQTRFIFDLSLSRMGDVQIDGLLRDERLDLVIRTQNAFSLPMQQTMRQAYSTALDQTDLTGELNFQGSTKNWVHVLEQQEQLGVHV